MTTQNVSEAEAFHAFLGHALANGGKGKLPEELLQDWRAQREYDVTVAELGECIADMEAGKGRPLSEFADEMRAKYKIPPGSA